MPFRSSTSSSDPGLFALLGKLAVCGFLLLGIQGVIATLWPLSPSTLQLMVRHAIDRPARVLYVGDSVLFDVAAEDTDKRPLARIVKRKTAPISLEWAAMLGLHAEMFEICIDYWLREGLRPELIVIPITLRSFAPIWRYAPGLQFADDRLVFAMDRPILRWLLRPAQIWQAHARWQTSDRDFRRTHVATPDLSTATIASRFGERLTEPYDQSGWAAADYLTMIDREHPRLEALVRIQERDDRPPVLFYLTPTDVESGRSLLGPVFDLRVRANVATLVGTLRSAGGDVIDWSELLSRHSFSESRVINEHLNDSGRMILAEEIAAAIRARIVANR